MLSPSLTGEQLKLIYLPLVVNKVERSSHWKSKGKQPQDEDNMLDGKTERERVKLGPEE